jgi:hypothetical protein
MLAYKSSGNIKNLKERKLVWMNTNQYLSMNALMSWGGKMQLLLFVISLLAIKDLLNHFILEFRI